MLLLYVMGNDFPNFKLRANELWHDELQEEHIHYLKNASFLRFMEKNVIEQWMTMFQWTLDKMSERSRDEDLVCIVIIIII